jgi:hypothetical protein
LYRHWFGNFHLIKGRRHWHRWKPENNPSQSNTDCTHGTVGAGSQFRLDSPCQGAAKQARHRWFGFSLLISSVKVFETIYPDQRNLYISGHLMG